VSNDFQIKLRSLLTELAGKNRSYSGAAGNIATSISADLPPIALPDAVISLMESGVIDSQVAYTQEDLLAILKSVSSILLSIKSITDTEDAPDGLVQSAVAEFTSLYSRKTNAEILAFSTTDFFVPLDSIRRYALALVLDDLAADRKLNKPPVWQTILDNHGILG